MLYCTLYKTTCKFGDCTSYVSNNGYIFCLVSYPEIPAATQWSSQRQLQDAPSSWSAWIKVAFREGGPFKATLNCLHIDLKSVVFSFFKNCSNLPWSYSWHRLTSSYSTEWVFTCCSKCLIWFDVISLLHFHLTNMNSNI